MVFLHVNPSSYLWRGVLLHALRVTGLPDPRRSSPRLTDQTTRARSGDERPGRSHAEMVNLSGSAYPATRLLIRADSADAGYLGRPAVASAEQRRRHPSPNAGTTQ
jgi:hypothetical protein